MTTAIVTALLVAALHSRQPETRARVLAPLFERETREHALPRGLLRRLVAYESSDRTWAVSSRGAVGLGQIHQPLPAGLGTFTRRELEQPAVNLHVSAIMLASALKRCHGRIAHGLHVYDAGNGCRDSLYGRKVLAEQ